MATLNVRDFPEATYEALRERATHRRTSISAEAIRLIESALRTDPPGVTELLERIEKQRPRARPDSPSAADLIREDRDQR